MDYNLLENVAYCKEFVEHYSTLLYYSHIPAAIIALLVGVYIYFKSRTLLSKILLFITVCFAVWSALDLTIWMNYDHASIVMAAWAPIEIFSSLIFLLCLYFVEVFCDKRDISFSRKFFFGSLLLPLIAFAPTAFYLTAFDIQECTALESASYIQYSFYLKVILSVYLVVVTFMKYRKADRSMKKQIAVLGVGVICFILFFFVAGRISEYTLNYSYEIYGLFGMPIFIGFLAYLIVRFKTFQIKLLGAQALVFALVALVGSQFFFIVSPINRGLNAATLALVAFFGYGLVRSVRREIQSRERIEKLALELEKANVRLQELDIQKTEFVSFATHQLRSPLASIKGNTSLILEGDLGPVSEPVTGILQTIYTSIRTMGNIVEDYLNVSRIELGTMKYALIDMDFKDLLKDVMVEQKVNIEAKGLTYTVAIDDSQTYRIKADPDKFKQVVMNLVDNSTKYTPSGSIHVSLEKVVAQDSKTNAIRLKITDTGVGIRKDVIPKLFRKFSRAPDASVSNIHGTGLGLFIAKEIMNAHSGRIWAESEGEGKGSQFYVELPEVK